MSTEPKSETEKGMDEIRREVIESRNLVIKTDNLLKNLHAEVKSVSKKQEEFQKRQWVSSGAAYVLFAALAVGSSWAVSASRISGSTQERDRLQKETQDLSAQLEKQRFDAASSIATEKAASEVYRMMTALQGEDRLKGVDALVRLDTSRLSPLERQALMERADSLRKEIGQSAFEKGRAAFHRNDMAASVEELTRFLALNPPDHDAVEASFYLGGAYAQLKKFDKAAPLLARYVSQNRSAKNRDYAMVLLAQAYEATGQADKAADVSRDALGTYPDSQFTSQLRARLTYAKRVMAGNPSAEPPAAALPPPAPASPPTAATREAVNKPSH